MVPRWTYTGTKLETADTAKEHLQPIGAPLLGETRCFASQVLAEPASTSIANLRLPFVQKCDYVVRVKRAG